MFFYLEECVGGSELSVLGDVSDFDVFVVFEVFHDDFFFVADDDDDFFDAAFSGCIKEVFEQWFIGDGEHDFGHGFGKWSEPFSFAGRYNNCFFYHESHRTVLFGSLFDFFL